jgi:hypothetical protein
MEGGIRAEVTIDSPEACPVSAVSARSGASAHSITKSVAPDAADRVAEEFVLEGDVDADGDSFEEVFSYGREAAYRFARERDCGCPCERIERNGCPVAEVYADDATLHLAFHAPDMDRLREVLTDLRAGYPQLDVQRLLQSVSDRSDRDLVVVDRSDLTRRQREVIETAHRMGYFEHPKAANAGEVADELGITRSTFTEHLAAAQSKLLSAVVES